MRAYEWIKRKRDGGRLEDGEIATLIDAYTSGRLPDYQAAALLMAVFFRGLDDGELAAWTRAMLESGDVLDLSDIDGVKVDKHSTGGVGDKISIPLAPLVAACGVKVPMMAGRGLGHTGGTLDKLESIEGFRVDVSVDEFRRLIREVGVGLIGQTERLAPADRKLYALRDATATVESIPLIASSIMSKKLAEGTDALVLDVKVGTGAFMKRIEDARLLAVTMVGIGRRVGRAVVARLTDMDQPLGNTVGNSLEILESIQILRGEGPQDTTELTLELGAEMLVLGKVSMGRVEAREKLQRAIADGSALERFRMMIAAQGGDAKVVDDPSRLPAAPHVVEVKSTKAGFITSIHAEEVGLAAMALGAGRARKEDTIDHAVGFVLEKKVGAHVEVGEVIARAHVRDPAAALPAIERLLGAYGFGSAAPEKKPLFLERIS